VFGRGQKLRVVPETVDAGLAQVVAVEEAVVFLLVVVFLAGVEGRAVVVVGLVRLVGVVFGVGGCGEMDFSFFHASPLDFDVGLASLSSRREESES